MHYQSHSKSTMLQTFKHLFCMYFISSGYSTDQETPSKPSDADGDKDVCLIDLTETDDEDSDDDIPMAASSTSSTPSVIKEITSINTQLKRTNMFTSISTRK